VIHRKLSATVLVSLLLSAVFAPLYVYATDLLMGWFHPTSKALIAAQIQACQQRQCTEFPFMAKIWSLDLLRLFGAGVLAAAPVAVAAALFRLRPWLFGMVVAAAVCALLTVKGVWLLFIPPRMPAWLFFCVMAAFTAASCSVIAVMASRLIAWVKAPRSAAASAS
jgi:hypothetical protein